MINLNKLFKLRALLMQRIQDNGIQTKLQKKSRKIVFQVLSNFGSL